MPAGRPPLYENPEQLEAAIEDYFMPVVEEIKAVETRYKGDTPIEIIKKRVPREKVTITGLAYHLGFDSRQSLYDYEEKPEFTYIVKKARLRVEMGYEERLMEGNCTGAIFALKNMGWKDKNEVDHTTNGKDMPGVDLSKLSTEQLYQIKAMKDTWAQQAQHK